MKFNRVMATGLCAIVLLSSTPAFAASVGSISDDKNVGHDESYAVSTEYKEFSVGQKAETDVYLTVDGEGAVVGVPISVVLDGERNKDNKHVGEYSISVAGDIAGDEILQVYPDKTNIKMHQLGKSDADAIVTQNKTEFTANDVSSNVVTTGSIESDALSAGSWSSEFNWIIAMKNEFIYYSTVEGAAADASNLTTENADVLRKDAVNAEAAVVIKDGTAHVYLMKDVNDIQNLIFAENTYFDLNGHTINFAKGAGIEYGKNSETANGTIHCMNKTAIKTSTLEYSADCHDLSIDITADKNMTSNCFGMNLRQKTVDVSNVNVTISGDSTKNCLGMTNDYGTTACNIDNLRVDIRVENAGVRGIQNMSVATVTNSNIFVSSVNNEDVNGIMTVGYSADYHSLSVDNVEVFSESVNHHSGGGVMSSGAAEIRNSKIFGKQWGIQCGHVTKAADEKQESYAIIDNCDVSSTNHVLYLGVNSEVTNSVLYEDRRNDYDIVDAVFGIIYAGTPTSSGEEVVNVRNCVFGDKNDVNKCSTPVTAKCNGGYKALGTINLYDCELNSKSEFFSFNYPQPNNRVHTHMNLYGNTTLWSTAKQRYITSEELANAIATWKTRGQTSVDNHTQNGTVEWSGDVKTNDENNIIGGFLQTYANGVLSECHITDDANVYDFR